MLKPVAFANAFTAVSAVLYVLCWLLSALAPELLFSFSKAWAHTVNLEAIRTNGTLDMGSALYGMVTWAALTWVTTYAGAYLYNRLARSD